MIPGFEKIIEERIQKALREGSFENLEGHGEPLHLVSDAHIPEDLRLAHKILKNADCLPPEIELKKEILRMEDLLADMEDTAEKYHAMKKLNFLIAKLNMCRNTSLSMDMPQHFSERLVERFGSGPLETLKK